DRTFKSSHLLGQLPAATGYGLELGVDIDGDGRQDLVRSEQFGATDFRLAFYVFRGSWPSSGSPISDAFQRIPTNIPYAFPDVAPISRWVQFADLDGDGRQDVLVTTLTSDPEWGCDGRSLNYYRNVTNTDTHPVQTLQFESARLVSC